MDLKPRSDSNIDSVLRAICLASSDAWCYAPCNREEITHCSGEFFRLLNIADRIPDESGVPLSFNDSRLIDGSKRLGMSADWLPLLFAGLDDHATCRITTETSGAWNITRKAVIGESGLPTGRLLLFRQTGMTEQYKSLLHQSEEAKQDLAVLSPRETEILGLVSTGLTNKAVARAAAISEKTIEKHRANIMRKLGAGSVADLIRRVTVASIISER